MRAAAAHRLRQRLSEEERRALTLRAGDLTALAQHPSWPVMQAVVEEKEEEIKRVAMGKMLREGLSEREQSYDRGFIEGMRFFARVPPRAERDLERELKEETVEAAVVQQEEEPEEEETPEEAEEEEGEEPAEEEEETEGEEEAEEEEQVAAYGDPEAQAFLAKYQGDVEKALRGAAELSRVFGRQGTEKAELAQRVADLESALMEAQALSNLGTPLNEAQRQWAEEASVSANPGAYVRQALQESQFELARAVCREWARENPYEAIRASQFIDATEMAAYQAQQGQQQNGGEPVSTQAVLEALSDHVPEMQSYWGQMAQIVTNLGEQHPLVAEARSHDPEQAMRGVIGIYEIARASNASVQGAKDKLKQKSRRDADDARKQAVVSSAENSPGKAAEKPRSTQLMPGLTLEQLETEFARE